MSPKKAAVTNGVKPVMDTETVKLVQSRLRELGYYDVGPSDGALGAVSQGAVLDFQNRNKLPLQPYITAQLLEALKVAQPKVNPEAQETATVADVSTKVAAVRANWWSKVSGWFLAAPAGVMTLASGIVNSLPDATDKITPVKNFLTDVPAWAWAGTIFAVAAVIAWKAQAAESSLVDGYQRGTVKEDHNVRDETPTKELTNV